MVFTTTAGSITGPHHRRRGEPNQDSLGYEQLADGVIVMAVADGAGSLPDSGKGSAMAVEIAIETIKECLESSEDYAYAVSEGLENGRYLLQNHELHATLGCTLTLAIAGPKRWAVGLVGDSFAVISKTPGEFELLASAPVGEFANFTNLLTSKNHDPQVVTGEERLAALALASDGLEQPSLQDGEPLPGFWTPLVEKNLNGELNLDALFAYMDSKDLISDDATLVVSTWGEAEDQ